MRIRDVGLKIAGTLLATLLLYPLSMGPAAALFARLHTRGDGPIEHAVLILYSPLNKLGDVSPAFGQVTDAYCTWWMRVTGSIVIHIDETAE